jgi:hypothetical protein
MQARKRTFLLYHKKKRCCTKSKSKSVPLICITLLLEGLSANNGFTITKGLPAAFLTISSSRSMILAPITNVMTCHRHIHIQKNESIFFDISISISIEREMMYSLRQLFTDRFEAQLVLKHRHRLQLDQRQCLQTELMT